MFSLNYIPRRPKRNSKIHIKSPADITSTGVIFILGKRVSDILASGVNSTWSKGSSEPGLSNYGDKIIYCAMYLYIGYVNEATNFAESQGGGGSDTKDWGREKDEDEIEWIRRCLRQATRMVNPKCGRKIKR